MKPNDSSSTTPFSDLVPLEAPAAPSSSAETALLHFPSFEQVLQHAAGVAVHPLLQLGEAPPSKPPSIFDGLLGGRLEVLLDDIVRNPSRYDDRTQALLGDLASGAKRLADLPPAERAVLDSATLDFAAFRPPKPPPAPKPALAPAKKPALLSEPMADGRAPQVETPGGVMTPYWWIS